MCWPDYQGVHYLECDLGSSRVNYIALKALPSLYNSSNK